MGPADWSIGFENVKSYSLYNGEPTIFMQCFLIHSPKDDNNNTYTNDASIKAIFLNYFLFFKWYCVT